MSRGSLGPASVEFWGTPQARSTSFCDSSLLVEALERAKVFIFDGNDKQPLPTVGMPFQGRRRIAENIICYLMLFDRRPRVESN